MAFELVVNGTRHTIDADPQTPLLWVIRDQVGLSGTKFSCGIGQCGACTLHVDGRAVRSCSVPAASAIGKPVMTIEGLSSDGSHPIQVAWKELDTPQCGYCQSGMIMSTLALLRARPNPTDADIDAQIVHHPEGIFGLRPDRRLQLKANRGHDTSDTIPPIGPDGRVPLDATCAISRSLTGAWRPQ